MSSYLGEYKMEEVLCSRCKKTKMTDYYYPNEERKELTCSKCENKEVFFYLFFFAIGVSLVVTLLYYYGALILNMLSYIGGLVLLLPEPLLIFSGTFFGICVLLFMAFYLFEGMNPY